MYRVLTFTQLVRSLAFMAVVVGIGLAFLMPPQDFAAVLRLAGLSSLVTLIVLLALGNGVVFPWIWRIPLVQTVFFPFVNGTWRGTVSSNWPVIEALHAHAVYKGKSIPLEEISFDRFPPLNREVEVTIEASFFKLEVRLQAVDAYSESLTLAVQPLPRREHEDAKLLYLYKAKVPIPKATDADEHYGAGVLDVRAGPKGLVRLEGHYWTDREWQRGKNTAGQVVLERATT